MKARGNWLNATTAVKTDWGTVYFVQEKIQDILEMIPKDRPNCILHLTLSGSLFRMMLGKCETVVLTKKEIVEMYTVHKIYNLAYEWKRAGEGPDVTSDTNENWYID